MSRRIKRRLHLLCFTMLPIVLASTPFKCTSQCRFHLSITSHSSIEILLSLSRHVSTRVMKALGDAFSLIVDFAHLLSATQMLLGVPLMSANSMASSAGAVDGCFYSSLAVLKKEIPSAQLRSASLVSKLCAQSVATLTTTQGSRLQRGGRRY